MGITATVETAVVEVCQTYEQAHPERNLRVLNSEMETIWHKLDHLLYLPILGLERPRCLYYYQGDGLRILYGFTYKYLPIEHFLGQLTHVEAGQTLAADLADCYSQAWYPGQDALPIYSDWHSKPHWTKERAHSGSITMWGRLMPGTKQLLINGPEGHLIGGWNHPVDSHFSQVMVEWEGKLADMLDRPLAYTILDSEGGGLPIAQEHAQRAQAYLSVLPRGREKPLNSFALQSEWQPVARDGAHEVVDARWADAKKASEDPRRLIVMRPVGRTEPTRVYAGVGIDALPVAEIPQRHRARWQNQERRIRELIGGANLNANYGYTYQEVPSRTHQRRWQAAQESVEVIEGKLAQNQEAISNLTSQLEQFEQTTTQRIVEQHQEVAQREAAIEVRRLAQRPVRRMAQGLQRVKRELDTLNARLTRRRDSLLGRIDEHQQRVSQLEQERDKRTAERDATDTQTMRRERNLEKDQIMFTLQVLLLSLHDWVRNHFLAPEWQRLELETATQLLYSKPGWVTWHEEWIEIVLEPYRYAEQQRAMEATCQRFNAANLCWRDGRLLRMRVAHEP
jgi:hypothetical protein